MIQRYTRPEMGAFWTDQNKFEKMLLVEKAVAKVQGEKGLIPKQAAQDIQNASFSLDRIFEIEKDTQHDVIAFVSAVAESVGENGRYVHYGLTSSDVLDTALSLQVQEAGTLLLKSFQKLKSTLKSQAEKYMDCICVGRTHGVHAEVTTFGFKLAGYLKELSRNEERFQKALKQMAIGKLSGAVGTYSFLSSELEKQVCDNLNLSPESVATQVIPRDRHGELILSLALLGAGLERLAVELRHLQRTEVNEVQEGFSKKQKGSSAMPHKKNPISSENLTGVSRLLRSYSVAAQENIALWHERDISHSSVERVMIPDAFILSHYALERMSQTLENLVVNQEQMKKNIALSQGRVFSSHVLLALVEKGLSREEGYELVQSLSLNLKEGESLKDKLKSDAKVKKVLTDKDIEEIFSEARFVKNIKKSLDDL